jgi:hypothetical protein
LCWKVCIAYNKYSVNQLRPKIQSQKINGKSKPNAMWTGHNSPLYGRPEEESEDSPGYHWNANFSAHYWLEGGARKSQLLLGLAAYGRGFTLANEVRGCNFM